MKKLFAVIALLSLLVPCFGQSDSPDPGIAVEPQSQTALAGTSLTLTVTATGTAPLDYQWWDSAGAIPDATNASYTLDPAEPTNSDNYFVTVNNAFGSITSSVASVTIDLPPSILVPPMGQTALAGTSLTLTVTAAGTAPLDYQWWDSAGAIPDATNASYTLDPAEPDESDNYTITISNAFGSITSSVATVSIGLSPSISVQPTGQAVVAGSAVTLSVTAAGSAPLNYQWWDSVGAIPDATNASYTLDPAEPTNSDNYFVTVNNSFGSITSSVATVSIDLPPSISVQPMAQMVVEGSNATFWVVATGEDLHYQWYGYGGNDANLLDGATNASLTVLTDGEGSQVYDLSVVVTNLAGEVISSNASLTVLTVLTGPINPYPPGTLGYDLFQSTFTLASSTNRTASYEPLNSNLGTNSAVWTWPVNLSCVGRASDYYQAVLIASNELLTCAHDNGEVGQTVTFHDTNGVSWVGVVTNVIDAVSDLDISQLSNSAPASIVIPHVLPPDYASYIAGNSLLGMPAFWVHGKAGTIDYAPVAFVGVADLFGGQSGTWIQLIHNGYGAYSGTSAVGGDSGDPGFMSLSNNPILLFALDLSPDSGGMFVSGQLNWYWLSTMGLTNGWNILDLSGYPLQSAATPTPDYNYIVPPTNQLASPGTLVTFAVSVCVFDTSPFAYQWQWNGTNLAGATNAVLTFRAATTNAGNYSVIVSNELGSVTAGATLTLTSNQLAQILAPVVTKGQFQFGFNTISNYNYSVQYEDNLASGSWVAMTNFTGSGSYWQIPPLPLVKQRFYRFVTSSP
jgi:hypothetical protein